MATYKTFPCKFCQALIHWGQDPTTDKFVAYDEHGDIHACRKGHPWKQSWKDPQKGPKQPRGDHFGLGSIEGKGKRLPDAPEPAQQKPGADDWELLKTVGLTPGSMLTHGASAIAKLVKRMQQLEERVDKLENS